VNGSGEHPGILQFGKKATIVAIKGFMINIWREKRVENLVD
jgi:hypothetical protein